MLKKIDGAMRVNIKNFVEIISRTLNIQGPIYEFGALRVHGQEDLANLRPFFPGIKYIGADMREGDGVDEILNLHDINLPDEAISTVLCMDTLEHVEYPAKAMEEIHRILSPNGIAVISSVMYFPVHDFPNDFWRFTPEGFKSLLKPFENNFVSYAGEKDFPHTVIGLGFKGAMPNLDLFYNKFEKWQKEQSISQRNFRHLVKKLLPNSTRWAMSFLFNSNSTNFSTNKKDKN